MEAKLQKSLDLIDILLKSYTKEELLLELKIHNNSNEDSDFIISSIISNLEKQNHDNLLKQYNNLILLLETNQLNIYNKILNNINIEKLDVLFIIALLRLSYLFKSNLSEWNIFLNKSIIELNNRKLNTNQLLIGLI